MYNQLIGAICRWSRNAIRRGFVNTALLP